MSDQHDLLKAESKEQYDQDAAKYFRNVQDSKKSGMSADERALIDSRLPGQKEQAEYADMLAEGLDKTKRSGAAVNSPSAVPAIFPGGLSKASAFIDRFTPGKYKAPEEAKPLAEQKAPTGYFPKPSVVLDRCLDCMEPVSQQQYVLGMTIVTEEDSNKLAAMKVKHGDLIVYNVCVPCFEAAKEIAKDTTPLVLVFGGELTSPRDLMIANKYGFPVQFHSGSEKNYGQFKMIERAERVMDQLWQFLTDEPADSPIFRKKEVVNGN